LGNDFDEVNDATLDSAVYRGNQMTEFIVPDFPGNPCPESLIPDMIY
jgi:hypothetical protein